MKAKTPLMVVTALGLVVAGGLYLTFYIPQGQPEPGTAHQPPAAQAVITRSAPVDNNLPEQSADPALELAVIWLERYGETIHEPATQALLYPERQALIQARPQQGIHLFRSAVETAFPDASQAILTLMANLDRYHDWLDLNELRLQALQPMQRELQVWQQRDAIFGALARQIWADEKSYLEERSETFQQQLAELDQSNNLPLSELAHQLKTSAEEVYGSDLNRQFAGSGALGHALLNLNSVQSQLAELPPEQRQPAINDLRRQLGFSDTAIERMAQQDQAREEKWQYGESYTAKREALAQRLTGEQLEAALSELREEHFGIAAPTIEREEEQGFYRFERPRKYGMN